MDSTAGLDRSFILYLAQGEWIHCHLNILVFGPTCAGKSYLTFALDQYACGLGFSVRYHRSSRLVHEIMLSHVGGSFTKMLTSLARVPLFSPRWSLRPCFHPSRLSGRCGRLARPLSGPHLWRRYSVTAYPQFLSSETTGWIDAENVFNVVKGKQLRLWCFRQRRWPPCIWTCVQHR